MTQADKQYNELVKNILENGYTDEDQSVRTVWKDGSPAHTLSIIDAKFTFDNSEVPILTSKAVAWKTSIKETLWMYVQQSNVVQDLRDVSVSIWNEWENEEGNIGRSYGSQLESHRFRNDRAIVEVEQKTRDIHGELKNIFVGELIEPNTHCKNEIIGKVFTSNRCGDARVIDVMATGDVYDKHIAVKLQFLNTGYIVTVQNGDFKRGKFVDKYARTVFDVGYLGDIDSVKNFTKEEIKTLKARWSSMILRCYKDKSKSYLRYGGKGVFVDERWHSFENYLRDVRMLPQYFLAKKDNFVGWEIDKDYYKSNCYSFETCVWLSSSDNSRYTSRHRPFYVTSEIGERRFFIDLRDACDVYKFDSSNLSKAVRGLKKMGNYKIEPDTTGKIYRYELSRNQVNELIHNIKNNPASRRLMISFWNYADVTKKQLQECVYEQQWFVKENKLHLTVRARSQDMALGNPFNIFQYNVLQRMIAQVTGYELGEYNYIMGDAHVYTRHIEDIAKQIEREQFEAPQLWINPEVKNFYDFTIDDFKLIGYKHGEKIPYEVAI